MNPDIKFYLSLFFKRLPIMVVLFILCAGVGIGLALTMPPQYVAKARLLVESAQISVETQDRTVPAERLQVIEERLRTRSVLIDLANQFDVFNSQPGLKPDAVVATMNELAQIGINAGRNRASLMTISFASDRADVAAKVVNELVTLVQGEDVKNQQDKAQETVDFYKNLVERIDNEIRQGSAAIVAFKEANKDALPEGLDFRLDRQSQLQERINLASRDRTSLNEQRNRLIAVGSQNTPGNQLSPKQLQLEQLKAELNAKRASLSGNHPTIKLLIARIDALESTMVVQVEGSAETSTGNPVLDLQLAEIDSRLASINEEVRVAQIELDRLQVAIEKTPENQIRLESLERDYEHAQTRYGGAARALEEAQLNLDIEDLGGGERITILDPAVTPTTPASPNRKLIAGGGVVAGTALATLFFILAELVNRNIRRPADLTRGLGIQPLATIPYIESEGVRRRRVAFRTILIVAIIIAIPVALWFAHTNIMPLDLLVDKVLARIGL